jgi:hypothetical protein
MNNANSIEDVISSFQKFNPFKDLDLSQIPDTDISAQIAQARTFNQTMSNAIFGDGTGTGSTASVSNLLIQLLDLINNNASEEQIIEFFATTTKDVFVALIRTLLTPIFDELQQQTTGRGFKTQGMVSDSGCIASLVLLFVVLIATISIVAILSYLDSKYTCPAILNLDDIQSQTENRKLLKRCEEDRVKLGTKITITVFFGVLGGIGTIAGSIYSCRNAPSTPVPPTPLPVTQAPSMPFPSSFLIDQGICHSLSQKRKLLIMSTSCSPCEICNKRKYKRNVKVKGENAIVHSQNIAIEVKIQASSPQILQITKFDGAGNPIGYLRYDTQNVIRDFDIAITAEYVYLAYSSGTTTPYSLHLMYHSDNSFIDQLTDSISHDDIKLQSLSNNVFAAYQNNKNLIVKKLNPQINSCASLLVPGDITAWDIKSIDTVLKVMIIIGNTLKIYTINSDCSYQDPMLKTSDQFLGMTDLTVLTSTLLNMRGTTELVYSIINENFSNNIDSLLPNSDRKLITIPPNEEISSSSFALIYMIGSSLFFLSGRPENNQILIEKDSVVPTRVTVNTSYVANTMFYNTGNNDDVPTTPAPPTSVPPSPPSPGGPEEQNKDDIRKTSQQVTTGNSEKISPQAVVIAQSVKYFWISVTDTDVIWRDHSSNIDILNERYITQHVITKNLGTGWYAVVSKFDIETNQYKIVAKTISGSSYIDFNTVDAPRRYNGKFSATNSNGNLYIATPTEQNKLAVYKDKTKLLSLSTNNADISLHPEDLFIIHSWSQYNVFAHARRYIEKIKIGCLSQDSLTINNNFEFDASWFRTFKVDTFTNIGIVTWQVYSSYNQNGIGNTYLRCFDTQCQEVGAASIMLGTMQKFHDAKLISDDAVVLLESLSSTYTVKVYTNLALRLFDIGSQISVEPTATTNYIFEANEMRDMTLLVKQALQPSSAGTSTTSTSRTAILEAIYAFNTDVYADTITVTLSDDEKQASISISGNCQAQTAGQNNEIMMNEENII